MTITVEELGQDDWAHVMSNGEGMWGGREWPPLNPRAPVTERGTEQMFHWGLPFTYHDVATVEASWEERGDYLAEWSGVAVLTLKDGRWAMVSGWCDTTGWGCQDGVSYYATKDREQLFRYGLDDRERAVLDINLDDEIELPF